MQDWGLKKLQLFESYSLTHNKQSKTLCQLIKTPEHTNKQTNESYPPVNCCQQWCVCVCVNSAGSKHCVGETPYGEVRNPNPDLGVGVTRPERTGTSELNRQDSRRLVVSLRLFIKSVFPPMATVGRVHRCVCVCACVLRICHRQSKRLPVTGSYTSSTCSCNLLQRVMCYGSWQESGRGRVSISGRVVITFGNLVCPGMFLVQYLYFG